MNFPEKQPTLAEEDAYELSDIDHELVLKYEPKFIAKGGEHIVYEAAGHPDVVVKVASESLRTTIDWNAQHDLPMDSLPNEIDIRAREYIKEEARRFQQLKAYFGAEHVLSQKKFLSKVPVTEDALNNLYEGHPPLKGSEAWAVIAIQKRAEELSDPDHLALVAGYAEQGEVSDEGWKAATDHLIFGESMETPLRENEFLEVQSNERIKALLKEAESDTDLKDSLKELIEKSIIYTEETGEILDLIGDDNIVFSKKDGKWNYRLVDALYPHSTKMVERAKAIILKLSTGTGIDESEQNVLMNAFNYIRTINGLAEQLGVEKRLSIVPKGMGNEVVDYLKLIRENLTFTQD
jgi:hypothetical protein